MTDVRHEYTGLTFVRIPDGARLWDAGAFSEPFPAGVVVDAVHLVAILRHVSTLQTPPTAAVLSSIADSLAESVAAVQRNAGDR